MEKAVHRQVSSILADYRVLRDYKSAASKAATYILKWIRQDSRIPENDWNWSRVYEAVYLYVYQAMVLQDLSSTPEDEGWGSADWLLSLADNCREELIPRLLRYKGKVKCHFEAGFRGLTSKNE